jgi:glucan phosphoethanolaminetransferase (alkaline phosphatase superfamily)
MQPSPVVLNPFPTPSFLQFDAVTIDKILTITLVSVFIAWGIYTLIVSYHWIRYSNRSLLTFPALALHLLVSATLFIFAITSLTS